MSEFNLSCPMCKGDSDKCDCKMPEDDEELNLSDKEMYRGKDVKEFIRLLKERISFLSSHAQQENNLLNEIDKLAGEELSGRLVNPKGRWGAEK